MAFLPDPSAAPRFGVNWTPRRRWFHAWQHLDVAEAEEDFAAIAALGLDHVRIFPLWHLLQPNRTVIDERSVADVVAVVRAAARQGLDVCVDVLQGHLSSYEFLPSWILTWHRRNIFTDPDVVAAERDLVRALARALRDEPNAVGLTLGNELNQFADRSHPDPMPATPEEISAWCADLLGAARAAWPEGHHVQCSDDKSWYLDEHPFEPSLITTVGDSTTIHSWAFGWVAAALDSDVRAMSHFAEYLVALATFWSDDPNRPIWLQEVGAPRPFVPEEQASTFAVETVRNAIRRPQVRAVTWWCSHDVSPDLADYPSLEYSLGLIDSAGRVKAEGRAIADLIAQVGEAGRPEAPPPQHDLVLPGRRPADRGATAPGQQIFTRWFEAARAGAPPRLVTAVTP
ncbi:glycoside hydrolase 5 family protein [Occultella kanbiaonis]|uniref:glycoside hydrolase 5 family protein n=1 Tax=Occultella kanbiaonis TaxID=2675754 RepID=UPI0013D1F0FF|nr:cellulase family glycosylhydrolase [Occultella kanbiaonis]